MSQTNTIKALRVADAESVFLDAIRNFAELTLRPRALQVDAHGVDPETIESLRGLGALNYLAPESVGGLGFGAETDRAVHEILAGACLNTWLIWVQHTGMVAQLSTLLEAGSLDSELAREVVNGNVFSGAALSDVRHFPKRYISAAPTTGGWLFNGTVSWFTGWGINQAILIAGVHPESEKVITSLVALGQGFSATALPLSAAGGSRTVKLDLEAVFIPDESVINIESFSDWKDHDGRAFNDAKPSTFGLAWTIINELLMEPSPDARRVAEAWTPRVEQLRAESYKFTEPQDDAAGSPLRLARRAKASHALLTLSQALLTARAGRGVTADNTALLHVRNALFLQIQGQSVEVRTAQLQEFLPPAA